LVVHLPDTHGARAARTARCDRGAEEAGLRLVHDLLDLRDRLVTPEVLMIFFGLNAVDGVHGHQSFIAGGESGGRLAPIGALAAYVPCCWQPRPTARAKTPNFQRSAPRSRRLLSEPGEITPAAALLHAHDLEAFLIKPRVTFASAHFGHEDDVAA